MGIHWICDECGEKADTIVSLETGHVEIGGQISGQIAYLCEKHAPHGNKQPTDCKRVKFLWAEPAPYRSRNYNA